MKRRYALLLAVTVLLGVLPLAGAQAPRIMILQAPALIRPGKPERIAFTSVSSGEAALTLLDASGATVATVYERLPVLSGENAVFWNGYDAEMRPVAPGEYRLFLRLGEDTQTLDLTVGDVSPQITRLTVQDAAVTPGEPWGLTAEVNMAGSLLVVLHVADKHYEIYHGGVESGMTRVNWDGLAGGQPPPPGTHTLSVLFMDETGFAASQQHITLDVLAPTASEIPDHSGGTPGNPGTADGKPAAGDAGTAEAAAPAAQAEPARKFSLPTGEEVPDGELAQNYWKLPVGVWDEEKIWKVMQQPITVLFGKDQRDTYKLRAARDDSAKRENILGEISYESQGVHVLEQYDDGWSLVEAYNSSYGPDNRSRRGYGDTDALIRGYIRTSELKTVTPRDDYGILIDKHKQLMYVFKEGKLFTELVISTGIPTRQQPWNETPSGEFLMISRTGDFTTGNLVCRMAMRINAGVLIHEVPYIVNQSTGYWDYSSQEAQLGKKASHGCIRVQRRNNDDGINMTWLWSNIKVNTKVLVWDDDGRYHEYPDAGLPLFYNPDGGKYYHLDQNCSSIKNRFLPLKGETAYGQLEDELTRKLTPCPYCKPPVRSAEIDELNRENGF